MNPYEIIGVSADATPEQIKAAYRKKAFELHPDRNKEPGAEDKFKELNAAYDKIKNGTAQSSNDPFSDFMRNMHSRFEQQFAEQRKREENTRNVVLTLEECFAGKTVEVDGHKFDLPAGIDHGNMAIGRGMAKDGSDLYVRVIQASHSEYERHGPHLIRGWKVDPFTAIIGGEIEVTHVSGKKIKLMIPANTKDGLRLRAPGGGMPDMRGGDTGDLYVQVEISDINLTPEIENLLTRARDLL